MKQQKQAGPSDGFLHVLPSVLHVKETEDNEPVVSTMMELHRVISSKHLPAVQGWVQVRPTHTRAHTHIQYTQPSSCFLRLLMSQSKSYDGIIWPL